MSDFAVMGTCVDQDVLVTAEDLAEIRKLEVETRPKGRDGKPIPGARGMQTLRTPEAFPDIYSHEPNTPGRVFVNKDGRKYRPTLHAADGTRETDSTRWFERRTERWFLGSTRWPDGIPIGTTRVETRDVMTQNKYSFTDTIYDVSHPERERMKDLARGDKAYTEAEKMSIARRKEQLRAQRADDALDPNAQSAKAAADVIDAAIARGLVFVAPPAAEAKAK